VGLGLDGGGGGQTTSCADEYIPDKTKGALGQVRQLCICYSNPASDDLILMSSCGCGHRLFAG